MTRLADCDAGAARWQDSGGLCAVVLHEVFSWLEARTLATAGGVCCTWRRAASAPALWRRLLARDAHLSLARTRALAALHVSWRDEYVRSFAGWERCEEEEEGAETPGLGGAQHAVLAVDGGLLAIVSEDAELAIWQPARVDVGGGSWRRSWSCSLRAMGWRAAVRAQWADHAPRPRLLLAGMLALADSWELLALQMDESGAGRVTARARCSAGAAGCWSSAAGDAFLSLELRLLAPRLAVTTVWLNAATQEMESEYAGVRSPVLRCFNQDGAHFTLAAVVEAPAATPAPAPAPLSLDDDDDDEEYFKVTLRPPCPKEAVGPLVVCGSGVRGAGSLLAWRLRARHPAPLLALEGGDLAARRARVAARAPPPAPAHPPAPALPPAPDPPPPTETEVRAMCSEPAARLRLPAPPAALVPHDSGRCAWVSLSGGGAWCASLPTLRPLRRLLAPDSTPPGPGPCVLLHVVQPSLSSLYIVSPRGALTGDVQVWSSLSGAGRSAPRHRAPVTATLLATATDGRPLLLVLAEDRVHMWRSRATPQLVVADASDARP